MKWRNQLLALLCLLVFAGLGVLYFQHWVVQKPFAIILFIGEGLTSTQTAATRLYVGGADARLSLDSMSHAALIMNASKDFAVPDQAAAATAIACGVKVNNRSFAIDQNGNPISTLLELAREHGRATGLVTNARLTDPTCAAFYSHAPDVNDAEHIAQELVDGQKIDIALGGGSAYFLPIAKQGLRQDGRDLILALRGNGFDVVETRGELEAIPAWRKSKLIGAFAKDELAFQNQIDIAKDQPALSDMVRHAVQLLQYNARGYLLIVDAGLSRKGAQHNEGERTLAETAELDRAVAMARRYAGERSTIMVCGDVGIGGMTLSGHPFRRDSGIALLGLNSAGQPWITWATGPTGVKTFGATKLAKPQADGELSGLAIQSVEPGVVFAKTASNTAEDVIAFGTGPGTEQLKGVIENTLIFRIIQDQL